MGLLAVTGVCLCLCIVTVWVSGQDSSARCEKLNDISIKLRDGMFRDPVLKRQFDTRSTEDYLNSSLGVDIYDNEELSNFCCQVVDCKTPSELASLLGTEKRRVEQFMWLVENREDVIEPWTEEMKQAIKKLQKWLVSSGFPDQWPVNTPFNVNKNLLKKNPRAKYFVTFGSWKLKVYQQARALTDATSLDEYLDKLQISDIAEDKLQDFLVMARTLSTKSGVKSVDTGLDQFVEFLSVLEDIKIAQ